MLTECTRCNFKCLIILCVPRTRTVRKQTVSEKKHCASQRKCLERTTQGHKSIENAGVDFPCCIPMIKYDNNSIFTSLLLVLYPVRQKNPVARTNYSTLRNEHHSSESKNNVKLNLLLRRPQWRRLGRSLLLGRKSRCTNRNDKMNVVSFK